MKALSLFSGCGGLDLGVEKAGFENVASIERDANAAQSLQQWKAQKKLSTKVIHADIRQVEPKDFAQHHIALLHGGPPCQAFSLIGKRKSLDDERGMLLFQIPRFAEILRPRAILVEQVKGLLSAVDQHGEKGGAFRTLIDTLSELGYYCKWAVLNAAAYGIPQKRERLFIVGIHKKNGFNFPSPTHFEKGNDLALFPLRPYETIGKYIEDLPEPVSKHAKPNFPNHIDVTTNRDRERISYVPEGQFLAGQTDAPSNIRMRLTHKDTTKYRRLHRDEPSLTLRGGEIFFHPTQDRYLTPREYLRIHTFPDDFTLLGPVRSRSGRVKDLDQHRQVANAVPPKLAEILAKCILNTL